MCQASQRSDAAAVETLLSAAIADPNGDAGRRALLKAAELSAQQARGAARALDIYGQVSAKYPHSDVAAESLLDMGCLHEQAGEFDKALAAYAEVAKWEKSRSKLESIISLVSRLAVARERFIRENTDTEYRPLRMYLEAQRLALRNNTRNEALIQLIRLAGLYPESTLVDDAFLEMTRIHLLKGDEPAARQAFDRLLKSDPRRLDIEPLRAIALRAAGWLLEDADRDVASESDVFPELAGYTAGTHLTLQRDASPAWKLDFAGNGGGPELRQVTFRMTARRAAAGETPTFPGLGLHVESRAESGSDVLAAEVRRTLEAVSKALEVLERAAATGTIAGAVATPVAPKSAGTGSAARG